MDRKERDGTEQRLLNRAELLMVQDLTKSGFGKKQTCAMINELSSDHFARAKGVQGQNQKHCYFFSFHLTQRLYRMFLNLDTLEGVWLTSS